MRQGKTEWLEAVALRCSIERMFLEISKNSQENTCARVSFEILAQVFSCEFCEIFKNTFFLQNTSGDCSASTMQLLAKTVTSVSP